MKRLVLLSIFVIHAAMAYSQSKGGLEIGGNMMNATFSMSEGFPVESSWGIRLGYVAEYYLSDHLYVRGAALINQRGFQFADERWGLNVIDVPINLGYAINLSASGPQIFVDGGINAAYHFRAFTKLDGELVTLSIGNATEDIKTFSNGFNVGTGLQFNDQLKVRLSYYHGLTNLVRTEGDEWKNRVFGLALNWFFKK